jgi:hypothetical protein
MGATRREFLFGLPKLGNAASATVPCFGTDVYNSRNWVWWWRRPGT